MYYIIIGILMLAAVMGMLWSVNLSAQAKTTKKVVVNKHRKTVRIKQKVKKKTMKNAERTVSKKEYYFGEYKTTKIITTITTTVTRYQQKKKIITRTLKTITKTTKSKLSIEMVSNKVHPLVIRAFKKMKYKITVNPKASYAGYFNARNATITLRSWNEGYLFHELGHYVAFISGFKDMTNEFEEIYQAEKNQYTGTNKSYAIRDCMEYFAESFRDYCSAGRLLKVKRPRTYKYLEDCINEITDRRVDYVRAIYYY